MNALYGATPFATFKFPEMDGYGHLITSPGNGFWDVHLKPNMDAVPAGRTMVDIGASLGFFTIYQATRGVLVHAFEPCPGVFELLVDNIKINHFEDRVTAHNVALYSSTTLLHKSPLWDPYKPMENGEINFDVPMNSAQFCLAPGEGNVYCMEARTLDSFGLEDVALIKSDAQGCDLPALIGAKETIARCKPVICFEYEADLVGQHGHTLESYEEFIEEIDYRIENIFHPDGSRADCYMDYVVVPK
jgi:FkbM family methyltransferase